MGTTEAAAESHGRSVAVVTDVPIITHTVLDAVDCRGLAEFYRRLLGLHYRPGAEPPGGEAPDDVDWLVLLDDEGRRLLAIQQEPDLRRSTWPSAEVPMQLHLDLRVPDLDALWRHRDRALELGAEIRFDRTDDPHEPLLVLADPEGHPFCLMVAVE